MRAASWDCHRSVLRNDTHAGRTLDPTARSEPIRCGKEYIAFRCRLKAAVPCGKKLWRQRGNLFVCRHKASERFAAFQKHEGDVLRVRAVNAIGKIARGLGDGYALLFHKSDYRII